MKKFSLLAILLPVFFVLLCGCGRLRSSGLPPEDTLYLPSPEDKVQRGSLEQSVCASDTQAYDDLKQWIDDHNDAIQSQIAIIKLLAKASARQLDRDGEFEYSAEREDKSITLKAVVAEDDAVTYDATFSGPEIEEYTFLDGTTAADRKSGQWTFHKLDGEDVIEVTWTLDGEDLTVERKRLDRERTITYKRKGTTATVVFVGTNHNATASWDTESKDGSFEMDGQAKVCWEHSTSDYCTVDCP